jgi:UDP-N-acetyl-D-mannosaminuronic acid dehydrogenase
LVENDRIIGGMTARCSQRAVDLYGIFVAGQRLVSDARTAEMCKLTENSFRDVNIAFANEVSQICERLQINPWELVRLANHHPRVNILQPGAGVGGHCIAVDPWFIVDKTPDLARLIRTAREVNNGKPAWILQRIEAALRAALEAGRRPDESALRIAVLGLAFKPNIDDLRESPAMSIAERLLNQTTAKVEFVEPNIDKLPRSLADGQLVTLEAALARADIVVVLVAHRQFQDLAQRLPAGVTTIDAVGVLG